MVMASLKTNKSFSKRLRVTRRGKVLRRKPGQDHFLAKESRRKQLARKGWENFPISKKDLSQRIPY
ncbi:MAG: 50S ribosomal protein L35 [Candidatus Niyogibacteria bacterium CG10_big_fil_rev_8_21_14_0_10_46_36]|uniref:50S ribosomal protein L35 n=1 Tax=Candidatus Niyogibacteria bacterium CG10_big_fil_rev_8_21_14_0_10_46_36 TaxID=1974726 RepID=A0A2H0TFB6_9BACT|nr:MAG: 50S ribosomal protein L35 [Candidatus Niyogibacteria bacterium CG10_big_fil_rev_8_21_14_0_10_46_36]